MLLDALSTLMQAPASRVIDKITTAYVDRLGTHEKLAVDALASAALTRLAEEPLRGTTGAEPVTTYEFSRLCFKRDVIEGLAPQDAFRVITPHGVFQMTKADFHRAFPNVAQSRSYLDNGLYHYPKLPARAEEFRIA